MSISAPSKTHPVGVRSDRPLGCTPTDSHVHTYKRTYGADGLRNEEISSFVTRAQAYGFSILNDNQALREELDMTEAATTEGGAA